MSGQTRKIGYAESFWDDLNRIREFIDTDSTSDNDNKASELANGILNGLDRLADYPELGQELFSLDNMDTGFRYFLYDGYIAVYVISGDEIVVLRLFDQREDYLKKSSENEAPISRARRSVASKMA